MKTDMGTSEDHRHVGAAGRRASPWVVANVSGELELQGESRKRQPRHRQPIAMANRGYDVVVDVDAEVGGGMRPSLSFLHADTATIGRSRPYRPSGGPRVPLIQ